MKHVRLTEEEHAKLIGLYRDAQTTPVLVYGPSWQNTARDAWGQVRQYMDVLAKKYGYDPKTASISADSPEFDADATVK